MLRPLGASGQSAACIRYFCAYLLGDVFLLNHQGNLRNFARYQSRWKPSGEALMRTSVLAIIVIAGSAFAFQATAQQQQAAPRELTKEQIDKGLQTSQPNQDADKGVKTRNSGESGYVGDQGKPGASAHPPGRPDSQQTTGSQTGSPK
jgi:hypothetical protein